MFFSVVMSLSSGDSSGDKHLILLPTIFIQFIGFPIGLLNAAQLVPTLVTLEARAIHYPISTTFWYVLGVLVLTLI